MKTRDDLLADVLKLLHRSQEDSRRRIVTNMLLQNADPDELDATLEFLSEQWAHDRATALALAAQKLDEIMTSGADGS